MIQRIIHIIAGIITAFLPTMQSFIGFVGFMVYEIFEYISKNDNIYIDIRDYMIGFYFGSLIKILFKICI